MGDIYLELFLDAAPKTIENFIGLAEGTKEFTDTSGLDATLELTSIDCTLALAEVYEQVTLVEDDGVA